MCVCVNLIIRKDSLVLKENRRLATTHTSLKVLESSSPIDIDLVLIYDTARKLFVKCKISNFSILSRANFTFNLSILS